MEVTSDPATASEAANVAASLVSSHPNAKSGPSTDEYLWIYVSPIILLLGLCGNILVLLVINRKNLRGTTTCVYLTVLAIFDTLALISGIIPEWTNACGIFQFSSIHSFTCQLEKFVFYTASDTAIWILVAFTLDRFVAVCFPLYKRSVCVPKRSKIACVVIFSLAFLKNVHVFWTRGLELSKPGAAIASPSIVNSSFPFSSLSEVEAIKSCGKKYEFKHFESLVRPWIAFATVSVLPFTILAICNSMIIWALARLSKNEVKTLGTQTRGGGTLSQSNDIVNPKHLQESQSIQDTARSKHSSTISINHNQVSATDAGIKNLASRSKTVVLRKQKSTQGGQSYKQTTMMCLSASITFLVCVFPSIVMLIGKPYWSHNSDGSNNHVYDVCKAINNQLAYLNHSINFFLYCITGRKFRHELVLLFKKCCSWCTKFERCRVFQKRGSYDPSTCTQSVTGKWKGKLSSIFVTNSTVLEGTCHPRRSESTSGEIEMEV